MENMGCSDYMISKEEAEEKLLKIFYDVKLDSYLNYILPVQVLKSLKKRRIPMNLTTRIALKMMSY